MSIFSLDPKRQPELDFIRGIAILLVLHYHYSPSNIFIYSVPRLPLMNFGWAGVDLFFVLSGFLVGGLLCKEWMKSGHVRVGRFLIRRGFKIWPAYYFYFLVEVVIRKHPLSSFFWPNLLNYQNYVRTSLSQTWSLAIEEHFYILLSLVIWWCSSRKIEVRKFLYGAIAVALAVTTYRTFLALTGESYSFQTHTRIDALLLGVMLAVLFHFWRDRFLTIQSHTALLRLTFGVCLLVLLFGAQFNGSVGILAADLGSAAFLLLLYKPGLANHGRVYVTVANIGVYSYGIYLWHVGVATPVMHVLSNGPLRAPYLEYPVMVVSAVALGFLMTKLIEIPFLRLREKFVPTVQKYEPTIGETPVKSSSQIVRIA